LKCGHGELEVESEEQLPASVPLYPRQTRLRSRHLADKTAPSLKARGWPCVSRMCSEHDGLSVTTINTLLQITASAWRLPTQNTGLSTFVVCLFQVTANSGTYLQIYCSKCRNVTHDLLSWVPVHYSIAVVQKHKFIMTNH